MPFKNNARCKICRSRLRKEIDLRLIQGQSSTEIIAFAKKNRLILNKYNVSCHNRKHRAVLKEDLNIEKSPRKAKQLQAKSEKLMADATTILNLVINRTYEDLISGEIRPTLTEGLKAVELLQKYNEGSPAERTIMQFIQGVHLGNHS